MFFGSNNLVRPPLSIDSLNNVKQLDQQSTEPNKIQPTGLFLPKSNLPLEQGTTFFFSRQPELAMKQPESIIKQPESIIKQPEPIIKQPEPIIKQPEPIFKQPEPIFKQHEPIFKQPERLIKTPKSLFNLSKEQPLFQLDERNANELMQLQIVFLDQSQQMMNLFAKQSQEYQQFLINNNHNGFCDSFGGKKVIPYYVLKAMSDQLTSLYIAQAEQLMTLFKSQTSQLTPFSNSQLQAPQAKRDLFNPMPTYKVPFISNEKASENIKCACTSLNCPHVNLPEEKKDETETAKNKSLPTNVEEAPEVKENKKITPSLFETL